MTSRRGKQRSGRGRALVDAGPALAGVGTMLVGVAAVAALFMGQPSDDVERPSSPVATPAVTSGSSDIPGTGSPTVLAAESLDELVTRLALAAADAGVATEPAAYAGSVDVGPQGGLFAELPAAWPPATVDPWTDVPPGAPAGAGRELLGTFVIGSPDVDGIYADPDGTYGTPMLIISASRRLAVETDEGDVLGMRSVEFSIDCRLIRDGRLGVPGYAGPYRIHERCGREPMLLVGIELRDPESSHLVSVLARVASTADIAALEHLLETFEIEAQGLPI